MNIFQISICMNCLAMLLVLSLDLFKYDSKLYKIIDKIIIGILGVSIVLIIIGCILSLIRGNNA